MRRSDTPPQAGRCRPTWWKSRAGDRGGVRRLRGRSRVPAGDDRAPRGGDRRCAPRPGSPQPVRLHGAVAAVLSGGSVAGSAPRRMRRAAPLDLDPLARLLEPIEDATLGGRRAAAARVRRGCGAPNSSGPGRRGPGLRRLPRGCWSTTDPRLQEPTRPGAGRSRWSRCRTRARETICARCARCAPHLEAASIPRSGGPESSAAGTPAVRAQRLTISATDWSVSRWWVKGVAAGAAV